MAKARIEGLDRFRKKLDRLEKKDARLAMRRAITAGTGVMRAAVKAATPEDEGLLKRAQASKVKNRGMAFSGVVGADVDKLKAASAASGKGKDGTPLRPTNIDHLVEFGHVTPEGKLVPPSGYMRKAAASAMPAAESATLSRLQTEIEKAATR